MSTIGGYPSIDVMEIPLRDAPSFRVPVLSSGAARDLTDCNVAFYIFRNADDAISEALIAKLSENDEDLDIQTPATAGIIFVHVSNADVALLSPQAVYFYQTVVTLPDGRPGLVNSGYLVITP